MEHNRQLQTNKLSGVLPWFALALIMGLLQATPDALTWLRYERTAVERGELWRLLTANFVHLGWKHLALNTAALLGVGWLFNGCYSHRQWTFILVASCLATSLGLYFFAPHIDWCLGLSGALHGVFAAGAIAWAATGKTAGAWLLAIEVAALIYEQQVGPMPFSIGTIEGIVITEAHIWGTAGGIAAAIPLQWLRRQQRN
jgi:rhomboid family GlyGly-CTERM serine protease